MKTLIKFFLTILFGLMAFLPFLPAFGAVAFDTASAVTCGSGSGQTISYTVTGTNTYLIVSPETGFPGADDITGITYNGVAMTRLFHTTRTRDDFLYYLVGPATGTHNIVISLNRSADSICTTATSYTGVNQVTPAQSNSCASATCSITTTTDNAWAAGTAFADSTWSAIAGERVRQTSSSQSNVDAGPVTPAGSVSLGMSGASGQLLVFMLSLDPISTPASAPSSDGFFKFE